MARESIPKKLFSLSGVLPLAFFSSSTSGRTPRRCAVKTPTSRRSTRSRASRSCRSSRSCSSSSPLAYHALYGVWMMRAGLAGGRAAVRPPPRAHQPRRRDRRRSSSSCGTSGRSRVQAWRGLDSARLLRDARVAPLVDVARLPRPRGALRPRRDRGRRHLAISAWGYGTTAGWFATKQQKTPRRHRVHHDRQPPLHHVRRDRRLARDRHGVRERRGNQRRVHAPAEVEDFTSLDAR